MNFDEDLKKKMHTRSEIMKDNYLAQLHLIQKTIPDLVPT